jgi:hypothetical protein
MKAVDMMNAKFKSCDSSDLGDIEDMVGDRTGTG